MFGNKLLKSISILGAIVMLGACATTETAPEVVTADTGTSTPSQGPVGPTPGSQDDLEQNAGHRIFFAYDEYTLSSQAQSVLARQASWLKQYPEVRVLVSGNCDERGTREYNIALGERRAEATKAYLVSLGVDRARITTVSYGKERPIDRRSNDAAWSLNRNSTTTISAVGA